MADRATIGSGAEAPAGARVGASDASARVRATTTPSQLRVVVPAVRPARAGPSPPIVVLIGAAARIRVTTDGAPAVAVVTTARDRGTGAPDRKRAARAVGASRARLIAVAVPPAVALLVGAGAGGAGRMVVTASEAARAPVIAVTHDRRTTVAAPVAMIAGIHAPPADETLRSHERAGPAAALGSASVMVDRSGPRGRVMSEAPDATTGPGGEHHGPTAALIGRSSGEIAVVTVTGAVPAGPCARRAVFLPASVDAHALIVPTRPIDPIVPAVRVGRVAPPVRGTNGTRGGVEVRTEEIAGVTIARTAG